MHILPRALVFWGTGIKIKNTHLTGINAELEDRLRCIADRSIHGGNDGRRSKAEKFLHLRVCVGRPVGLRVDGCCDKPPNAYLNGETSVFLPNNADHIIKITQLLKSTSSSEKVRQTTKLEINTSFNGAKH